MRFVNSIHDLSYSLRRVGDSPVLVKPIPYCLEARQLTRAHLDLHNAGLGGQDEQIR
jgi:hypothetical protein